jgi:hypothetical protein
MDPEDLRRLIESLGSTSSRVHQQESKQAEFERVLTFIQQRVDTELQSIHEAIQKLNLKSSPAATLPRFKASDSSESEFVRKDAKPNNVPKFSGAKDENFTVFWTSIENWFFLQPKTYSPQDPDLDERKVRFVFSCLGGDPEKLVASLLQRAKEGDAHATQLTTNFSLFSSVFTKLFSENYEIQKADSELDLLKEYKFTTYREFFLKLECLMLASSRPNLDDTSKFYLMRPMITSASLSYIQEASRLKDNKKIMGSYELAKEELL